MVHIVVLTKALFTLIHTNYILNICITEHYTRAENYVHICNRNASRCNHSSSGYGPGL